MHPIVRQHAAKIVVGEGGRKPEHADEQSAGKLIEPTDPSFRTPEQVAREEATQPEAQDFVPTEQNEPGNTAAKPPKQRRSFKQWLGARTKKQWIIFAIIVLVVLGGSAAGALMWRGQHKATPVASIKKVQPAQPAPAKSTTVASNLTGMPVVPSANQNPVTGIMIENSTFARPQSGLDHAGVVFEAVAEGGITRFLTLWQDTGADYIGPVRSVRPYYIQWAMGFDAAIAHVGGSPEALADMQSWNVKDLDQFANGSYYHRISSREAPHNVYTSMSELQALEAKKGYGAANYTGFARKAEAPASTPNATSIDFTISSSDFNVHYDYDAHANSYKRSEGGAPHMELDSAGNQTQIEPKVVIALVMTQGIEADDLHTSYDTIGSGHMFVFQDGTLTEGTWAKTSSGAQFTFTDATGKAIKLDPGQTWITVVNAANHVAYK